MLNKALCIITAVVLATNRLWKLAGIAIVAIVVLLIIKALKKHEATRKRNAYFRAYRNS